MSARGAPESADLSDGDVLFGLVEEFTALGDHRSGSDVDAATARWVAGMLRAQGLQAAIEPVGFDQWVGRAELTAGGRPLDCLAVPYEWNGSLETTSIDVSSFDPQSGGFPGVLQRPIAQARTRGREAVVLVTEHPQGSLVGVNRELGAAGGGHPVVLAAGRDLDLLRAGPVELRIEGRIQPGRTANVVAGNGLDGPPLILTTPLTGWFGCAGERGSGLAVLAHLVQRFRDQSLLVVATGGHELGFLGAHRWVDGATTRPGAIVHVGASIAVDEPAGRGPRQLIATRLAMTSLDQDHAAVLDEVLSPVGLAPAPGATSWIGEGQAWSRLGVPLLSTTGAGIDFHTPEDIAARATSPGSLARVAAAMGDATEALVVATRSIRPPTQGSLP